MSTGKTYTKEQLNKLFQAGINRGLLLYGMVMHGQMSKKDLDLLGTVFPDFDGALKECETKKK